MVSPVRWVLRYGKRVTGDFHREHVRKHLPKTGPVLYAGELTTHDWRLFDKLLPANFRPYSINDIPDYEEKLVSALRKHVRQGNTVVVIGGGEGTTAVIAAKLAAPTGNVICFEAAREQLPVIEGTAQKNGVHVEIRHRAVGEAISVYGDEGDNSPVIAPEDIPECDVLEMDCEGAERIILDRMSIRPPVIVVETHGVYNAPTHAVREKLERIGYAVTDLGWAEPRIEEECAKYDVRVLLGLKAN